MTRKYKFILLGLILVITLICNLAVRIFIIDEQRKRIYTLQKVAAAEKKARQDGQK